MTTGESSLPRAAGKAPDSFGRRSNLHQRILTAILLLVPTVYLAGFAPLWLFLPALVLTIELCLYEYFRMVENAGLGTFPVLGYLGGLVLPVAQILEVNDMGLGFGLVPVLVGFVTVFPLLALGGRQDVKAYLPAVAATLFGVIFIGLGLSWLARLRFDDPESGGMLVLFLFAVVWVGDVAAYFVGRGLGRVRFAPAISPKKTVEGAVGGLAGSLGVGALFAVFILESRSMAGVLILAAVVAVAGQVGDLAESALKRSAGVKDSSTILPGHGGLLDRLDSLLTAAPVLWLVLWLAGVVERLAGW